MAEPRMHYNRCPGCGRKFAHWNLPDGRACVSCEARDEIRGGQLQDWIRSLVDGEDPGPEPQLPRNVADMNDEDRRQWIGAQVRWHAQDRRRRESERALELDEGTGPPTVRERLQRLLWGA